MRARTSSMKDSLDPAQRLASLRTFCRQGATTFRSPRHSDICEEPLRRNLCTERVGSFLSQVSLRPQPSSRALHGSEPTPSSDFSDHPLTPSGVPRRSAPALLYAPLPPSKETPWTRAHAPYRTASSRPQLHVDVERRLGPRPWIPRPQACAPDLRNNGRESPVHEACPVAPLRQETR